MMFRVVVGMDCVGMVQALSPLCTPACTRAQRDKHSRQRSDVRNPAEHTQPLSL
jgi:hypothetical protein